MQKIPVASCPRCAKPVSWDERFPFRPFCSERCHMIDLGAWLNEEHRIAEDTTGESGQDEPDTGH